MCVCCYLQLHAGNNTTKMEFQFLQAWIGFHTLHIPAHAGNPVLNWGGVFQSLERCGSSIHEEYLGLRWRCCQLRALSTWRQAILCSTHHSCTIHLLSENRSCRHLEFLWSDMRWPLLTAHTFNPVLATAECYGLFQTPHRVSHQAEQTTKKSKKLR